MLTAPPVLIELAQKEEWVSCKRIEAPTPCSTCPKAIHIDLQDALLKRGNLPLQLIFVSRDYPFNSESGTEIFAGNLVMQLAHQGNNITIICGQI